MARERAAKGKVMRDPAPQPKGSAGAVSAETEARRRLDALLGLPPYVGETLMQVDGACNSLLLLLALTLVLWAYAARHPEIK